MTKLNSLNTLSADKLQDKLNKHYRDGDIIVTGNYSEPLNSTEANTIAFLGERCIELINFMEAGWKVEDTVEYSEYEDKKLQLHYIRHFNMAQEEVDEIKSKFGVGNEEYPIRVKQGMLLTR